ncbi:unnamed protein product [Trichobilharzia regenti]|nr:unnamed protein product [Trichobilharzia regenti]
MIARQFLQSEAEVTLFNEFIIKLFNRIHIVFFEKLYPIGVTSILLTNLLSSDANGIIDWVTINQSIDPTEEAFSSLLPQLIAKCKSPLGKLRSSKPINILIGLPLYSTSNRHQWFRVSQTDVNSMYASFYMWTNIEPVTDQQKRHYAYDSIRRAYYRHVHGNPNSPLLNLTNPNVS